MTLTKIAYELLCCFRDLQFDSVLALGIVCMWFNISVVWLMFKFGVKLHKDIQELSKKTSAEISNIKINYAKIVGYLDAKKEH